MSALLEELKLDLDGVGAEIAQVWSKLAAAESSGASVETVAFWRSEVTALRAVELQLVKKRARLRESLVPAPGARSHRDCVPRV